MTPKATTKAIKIGVVVVSFNSANDLPPCLAALGHASNIEEVIVIDNASTDASPEVVRSSGIATLIETGENLGFAEGCNCGLKALSPEIEVVAFMNPDVSVENDCLTRCAEALSNNPKLGGVAPLLIRPDGIRADSCGQVFKRFTLEVEDIGYGLPLENQRFEASPVMAACGALCVFRRSALDEISGPNGPWETSFFCFWEDFELGWRLTNAGWPISSLPEAHATHRRGAGASARRGPLRWRRPAKLEACILTNRWITHLRHLHTLDLLLRLPILLTWDLLLLVAGICRRPRLLGLVFARLPLVRAARSHPSGQNRQRLATLPSGFRP